MMTLRNILHKFPLLESLKLNLTMKTENEVEISPGDEPKFVKIKVNDDM